MNLIFYHTSSVCSWIAVISAIESIYLCIYIVRLGCSIYCNDKIWYKWFAPYFVIRIEKLLDIPSSIKMSQTSFNITFHIVMLPSSHIDLHSTYISMRFSYQTKTSACSHCRVTNTLTPLCLMIPQYIVWSAQFSHAVWSAELLSL